MLYLVLNTMRKEAQYLVLDFGSNNARYAALTIYCVIYIENLSQLIGKPTSFPKTLCNRRPYISDNSSNDLWYKKRYRFVLMALQIQCCSKCHW